MEQLYIQSLQNFIGRYSNLDSKEFSLLLKLFKLKEYKNKEHIVNPTEENNSIFYIISGLTRYYYLTDDGKEWNRAFLLEDMMSMSFSKDLGWVEPYGIQAIEDTVILSANFSDFQALFDGHPMIERLNRRLIESILIKKMNREWSFLQSSAKKRYIDFFEQSPNIFPRITQYHLASYLGITEASLSRIINEIG